VTADRSTTVARWFLVAAGVSLGAVLLRNLGAVPAVWPRVWDKAYNLTELLAAAVCGLRVVRASGAERGARAALTLGMFGAAAGDLY
jgi:hypothetical protein